MPCIVLLRFTGAFRRPSFSHLLEYACEQRQTCWPWPLARVSGSYVFRRWLYFHLPFRFSFASCRGPNFFRVPQRAFAGFYMNPRAVAEAALAPRRGRRLASLLFSFFFLATRRGIVFRIAANSFLAPVNTIVVSTASFFAFFARGNFDPTSFSLCSAFLLNNAFCCVGLVSPEGRLSCFPPSRR